MSLFSSILCFIFYWCFSHVFISLRKFISITYYSLIEFFIVLTYFSHHLRSTSVIYIRWSREHGRRQDNQPTKLKFTNDRNKVQSINGLLIFLSEQLIHNFQDKNLYTKVSLLSQDLTFKKILFGWLKKRHQQFTIYKDKSIPGI